MSYQDWKEHKNDCIFKNRDVYIELTTEYETMCVAVNAGTTIVTNTPTLVVFVYKREDDYCQPQELIESRYFGEPNEYNRTVAESFFMAKVNEHLQ